jgi:hypothetical protein
VAAWQRMEATGELQEWEHNDLRREKGQGVFQLLLSSAPPQPLGSMSSVSH